MFINKTPKTPPYLYEETTKITVKYYSMKTENHQTNYLNVMIFLTVAEIFYIALKNTLK